MPTTLTEDELERSHRHSISAMSRQEIESLCDLLNRRYQGTMALEAWHVWLETHPPTSAGSSGPDGKSSDDQTQRMARARTLRVAAVRDPEHQAAR